MFQFDSVSFLFLSFFYQLNLILGKKLRIRNIPVFKHTPKNCIISVRIYKQESLRNRILKKWTKISLATCFGQKVESNYLIMKLFLKCRKRKVTILYNKCSKTSNKFQQSRTQEKIVNSLIILSILPNLTTVKLHLTCRIHRLDKQYHFPRFFSNPNLG